MTAETIRQLLDQRPFSPFVIHMSNGVIHMSNGDVFEVAHPEFAMLLRNNLIVGFPDSDRFAVCALLHIANVQPLQPTR